MAELLLRAEAGRVPGSRRARRIRREGKVPGVVYGLGAEPVAVSVDYRELRAVLTTEAGLNALIDLEVQGERQLSIVKDLQRHPVRRDVVHVDFLLIDRTQDIEVEVPVVLVGEAEQVTSEDGIVDQVLFALTITAKPGAIPNELELDISDLEIGHTKRVADLRLPADVTTHVDLEEPVVVGSLPQPEIVEEPAEEEEEAEAVEGEEPEAAAEPGEAPEEAGDES